MLETEGEREGRGEGNSMAAKTIFFFLSALLLIFLYLALGTIDLRSQFFPDAVPALRLSTCTSRPLRVFMYDLPRRFNVGMIRRSDPDQDIPWTSPTLPPWPHNSGLKKQHSVEYWMMASLLGGANDADEEPAAARVLDPESADVFFVPFFSSLSFNTHGHNMTDPETEVDRKLQADVLRILSESKYWQQAGGRDHVIPMHHPNAFRFLRDGVNASILIVADFGRYPKSLSSLQKDIVAPYVHVVESFTDDDAPDPFNSRPSLLFFRGRTIRKDGGRIRSKLVKILAGHEGVHFEQGVASEEGIRTSTKGMRSSKFCLHPAGDTPSSCRLFDAIVSHCVPVIVSDLIELPYEDVLDYRNFSLFFSVKEALQPNYLLQELNKISKERWTEMWRQLKEISHHFEFQYPLKKDDAVNMLWKEVRHKVPAVKLAMHRSARLKIEDWWRR
ncbi:probable arabinosyltransferase ARAD1 [Nymphaea colorata]|nr:probable arabinosyltransferase ARAD1 [Nymphaea colorata]